MIINIFLAFIICGFGAELLSKDKYEKLLSFSLFLIVSFFFVNFYESWQEGINSKYIYHWIESKYLNVNLNLSSNKLNYAGIFPFMVLTLLVILNNTFYNVENHRLKLNGLVAMNTACLISLICSENIIQLLASSCVIEIIGFYIINDIDAKKKYMYYNLLADVLLFMLFAIIYGRLGSVDISALSKYSKIGAHRDLVAVLLLASVFIKSGLFMFQNHLLDLSFIPFNRLIFISYCSAPITGLIILIKTSALLSVSHYSIPILQIFSYLTIAWGLIGCLFIDNIKEKSVYINIMFYALFYGLMALSIKNATNFLPYILITGFLLNMVLEMISISASNEVLVSKMGGFIRVLKFLFVISAVVIFMLIQTVLENINSENKILMWSFLYALLVALAHILRQIFWGTSEADERVWALLKNPMIFFWLPVVGISSYMIYSNAYYLPVVGYVSAAFLVFMIVGPLRVLDKIYNNEEIQEAEYLVKIYDTLILTPIKILGRVLWLTVDFLFIEKTIIYSLTRFMSFMSANLQKLHNSTWLNYIVMTLLGIGVMFGIFYLRVKS